MPQDWSLALRFLSTEKAAIQNAQALRGSAVALRDEVAKGAYDGVHLTEFWALVQAASPTLRASNPELGARAGLGGQFFSSVARERRRPKLASMLRALNAIIDVANERLLDIEHPTLGESEPAEIAPSDEFLQLYLLANYLREVAKDELTKLNEERPNDAEAIERNEKLRQVLQLFVDGLNRIANLLHDLSQRPSDRTLLRKAKLAVDSLGREVSKWVVDNKADMVDCGMRVSFISAGVALLGTVGAEMTVATTAVAAMVGGPRVIDALRRPPPR